MEDNLNNQTNGFYSQHEIIEESTPELITHDNTRANI